MQRKDRTTATSIKIPDAILSRIDNDVEVSGEFASRTDWILTAIRFFEDYRHKLQVERKELGESDFISSSPRDLPADLRADNDDRN